MHHEHDLNPLALAALSLLVEQPMHPYEMQQMLIKRNEDRLVKLSFGSLYRAVSRLAERDYIRATGTDREGNRPERTTYEITDEGKRVFAERVAEILSRSVNEYPEFPVGLGHADILPVATVIRMLRKRVVLLRADITVLDGSIEAMNDVKLPPKFWLDKRYLRDMVSAEIATLTSLIDDLSHGVIDWSATPESCTE